MQFGNRLGTTGLCELPGANVLGTSRNIRNIQGPSGSVLQASLGFTYPRFQPNLIVAGHVDVARALLEAGADKHLSVGNPRRGINAIFMAVIQETGDGAVNTCELIQCLK